MESHSATLKGKLTSIAIFALVIGGSFLLWTVVTAISGGITTWANSDDPFTTNATKTFHYQVQVIDIDSNSNAVYTLNATVNSNSFPGTCASDYGCESGVNVSRIYWDNGGYTTFGSCSMVKFNFDDYIPCTATNGDHREYGIKILNKKV